MTWLLPIMVDYSGFRYDVTSLFQYNIAIPNSNIGCYKFWYDDCSRFQDEVGVWTLNYGNGVWNQDYRGRATCKNAWIQQVGGANFLVCLDLMIFWLLNVWIIYFVMFWLLNVCIIYFVMCLFLEHRYSSTSFMLFPIVRVGLFQSF